MTCDKWTRRTRKPLLLLLPSQTEEHSSDQFPRRERQGPPTSVHWQLGGAEAQRANSDLAGTYETQALLATPATRTLEDTPRRANTELLTCNDGDLAREQPT